MTALTTLQGRAMDAIHKLSRGGVAPSLRDLQGALELSSVSQAHKIVAQLEDRGAIRRMHGAHRSRGRTIEIIASAEEADILRKPTQQLRWLRDQIDRELRRRAW
jgi:SOS-response transcriptional repressor LexA